MLLRNHYTQVLHQLPLLSSLTISRKCIQQTIFLKTAIVLDWSLDTLEIERVDVGPEIDREREREKGEIFMKANDKNVTEDIKSS
ncbi:hypothetical protein Plhal304r1_c019g0068081 [Plasmopara halstedii]